MSYDEKKAEATRSGLVEIVLLLLFLAVGGMLFEKCNSEPAKEPRREYRP